jgi:transcriptional regulator with XRE-family HTH domain
MNEEKTITLGSALKKMREDMGLSLRAVEDSTGVSNAYLSQLENDKAKNPSANYLNKLAELYRMDFKNLLSLAGIVENETSSKKSFGEYVFNNQNLTEEEEEELIQYLHFIRRRKAKNKE